MKIWNDHGSEHSANLVMIGRFKDAGKAEEAKKIIDQLTEQVTADVQSGAIIVGEQTTRYTDGMMALLGKLNVHSVGPAELEQFYYDVDAKVDGGKLVVATDEVDVSAFLKVLIDNGARVEVYSAHDYPDTEKDSRG